MCNTDSEFVSVIDFGMVVQQYLHDGGVALSSSQHEGCTVLVISNTVTRV